MQEYKLSQKRIEHCKCKITKAPLLSTSGGCFVIKIK
nr:MAG TPA: hypothetical protein [Caudoviricetes sp.]